MRALQAASVAKPPSLPEVCGMYWRGQALKSAYPVQSARAGVAVIARIITIPTETNALICMTRPQTQSTVSALRGANRNCRTWRWSSIDNVDNRSLYAPLRYYLGLPPGANRGDRFQCQSFARAMRTSNLACA